MAERGKRATAKRMIGRYIVTDPAICHGQPTFRGTRILVADVLDQVGAGIAWETIVEEWRGDVPSDAISEAASMRIFSKGNACCWSLPEHTLGKSE